MSDGSIKIDIEIDGKPVSAASKELDRLEESGAKSGKGIKSAEDSMENLADSSEKAGNSVKGTSDDLDKMGNQSQKASGNVKKFAAAIGLIAIASAAFKVLSASMDDAITRFDTLNNFPKVLQALGVSAEDSEKAMTKLSDGIDGLPTKLDDIASTAQRMYSSFDDMDVAADSALALNNAFLGSGASAEKAKRGTEQYIQALQTGKMDMMQWRTLQETMDVGLIKIAEGFGYAGKSAKDDLYQALQDGTVTMDDFNDKLIEVGTGTGVMAGLAKENSLGIATSLGNLKIAAARGIADIIDSFNELSKEVTGKDIAQNIDGLKNIVNSSFKAIGSVIERTTPIFIFFADGVKTVIPVVETLTPAIIGLMTAYAAHAVITKAGNAIKASNAILAAAMTAQKGLTLVKKADTVATVANTGAVSLSNLAVGLLTGRIGLATAATVIKTAATYALSTALKFLSGPMGWVTVGIGALAGAAVAVVKWFKRTSAEADQLKAETEGLGEATNTLTEGLNSNAEAYKESQQEIANTIKANSDLADKIDELSDKENKSATEKAMLSEYVDQLNGSVEGLNLTYSEEADALSMSSEQLQARVDLMKEEEAGLAAKERLLEISKEQNEVDMQLEEVNALQAKWNELSEEGGEQAVVAAAKLEDLDEQEQILKETTKELGEQQLTTEEQFTTAMENITAATESGVSSQIIAFDELSESQQTTIENMKATWDEYKEAATNMFEVLNDEIVITAGEMKANLDENQRVMGEWADNIATLAERGVDQGLLDTLREAGPESAGHVNALVNASDEELQGLSEAFAKGGDTATDALSTSLGIEESGVMEAVGHLVADTEQSLREQINTADFSSIGGDVAGGLAEGIETNSAQAESASRKMAEDTTAATRKAFRTQSPSKEYIEIGGDLTDGLALGMQQGTRLVLRAVQNMFKGVRTESIASFNTINDDFKRQTNIIKSTMVSQFNSIGINSMSGLNSGLNAGSARVMATARRIANNVNATMKRALDIHSPSRKARDEVGKEYTAGVALGIEENARMAYDAVNKLASGMMKMSTPEVALGVNQMAYSSGGIVANQSSSGATPSPVSRNNTPQVINIEPADVIIDGRVAGKVLWKPVKENMDRNAKVIESFGG